MDVYARQGFFTLLVQGYRQRLDTSIVGAAPNLNRIPNPIPATIAREAANQTKAAVAVRPRGLQRNWKPEHAANRGDEEKGKADANQPSQDVALTGDRAKPSEAGNSQRRNRSLDNSPGRGASVPYPGHN